jgi:hypothetical protein
MDCPLAALGEKVMRRLGFSAALLGLLGLSSALAAPPELDRLDNWAAAIRPKASEIKWEKIPWILDFPTAIKLASKEKRPILVWAAGDPPLERC